MWIYAKSWRNQQFKQYAYFLVVCFISAIGKAVKWFGDFIQQYCPTSSYYNNNGLKVFASRLPSDVALLSQPSIFISMRFTITLHRFPWNNTSWNLRYHRANLNSSSFLAFRKTMTCVSYNTVQNITCFILKISYLIGFEFLQTAREVSPHIFLFFMLQIIHY